MGRQKRKRAAKPGGDMGYLGFGGEIRQVVLPRKVLDKGGLGGDVGCQADRLADIGDTGQQQEVARHQGSQEL